MRCSTICIAAPSLSIPLGSPSSNRSISPPMGFLVSRGDLCMFQRFAICNGNVPRDMHEKDGIVWRYFIQLQSGGKLLVGPARLVPTASDDPFARLLLCDCILHEFLQFRDGVDAVQREVHFVAARPAQMRVGIIETRHHETVVQLNCLCLWLGTAAVEQDMRKRADAKYLLVANGHGHGPGVLRIVRIDMAVKVVDGFVYGIFFLRECMVADGE